MPRTASELPAAERAFLTELQELALRYFLDNQTPEGLVLDRQRNFGPRDARGWCSTATTGMGFIALALSSADPFRFLLPATAAARVRRGLLTSLAVLEHTRGIVPHFIDETVRGVGVDRRSTIDSVWLVAGALWAAELLGDDILRELAARLYDRVDWHYWTETRAPNTGLLRHGADGDGHPLPWAWDRLNGETVFMYVLAAGAAGERAWPAEHWRELRQFRGTVAGLDFVSADLGLFVF